jgi:hypothetical protein
VLFPIIGKENTGSWRKRQEKGHRPQAGIQGGSSIDIIKVSVNVTVIPVPAYARINWRVSREILLCKARRIFGRIPVVMLDFRLRGNDRALS